MIKITILASRLPFLWMGVVTINKSNNQLSISICQKTPYLLEPLTNLYGGHVYIDRSTHQCFKWYVTKRDSVSKLINYFKEYPSRSAKNSRLHLIPRFYELKALKAPQAPEGSILNKSWTIFFNKWDNYDLDG